MLQRLGFSQNRDAVHKYNVFLSFEIINYCILIFPWVLHFFYLFLVHVKLRKKHIIISERIASLR